MTDLKYLGTRIRLDRLGRLLGCWKSIFGRAGWLWRRAYKWEVARSLPDSIYRL
jgi:hypothetical protein